MGWYFSTLPTIEESKLGPWVLPGDFSIEKGEEEEEWEAEFLVDFGTEK